MPFAAGGCDLQYAGPHHDKAAYGVPSAGSVAGSIEAFGFDDAIGQGIACGGWFPPKGADEVKG
jgi:hypothetical protein